MEKKWGDSGTYLTLWHCGDDVCDCYQPQLFRQTPHPDGRGYKFDMIWEGTFHSQPSAEEWEEFRKEGAEAIEKYKPDFIDDFFKDAFYLGYGRGREDAAKAAIATTTKEQK